MADREAAAAAQRFLRLVNALDHAIVWEFDDTAHAYTFVSDHAKLVLGYDAEAWLRDPSRFERCIFPDDLPAFLAMIGKLTAHEAEDLRIEHRCMTAEGRVVWVHTGVHRAVEHDHVLLRGVTIDINNIKEAEARERTARQQAEAATRNLEDVLAIVSHDIRNPLNSLLVAVELLRSPAGVNAAKIAGAVERSVQRLSALVDDLVDLASIRARQLLIQPTETTSETLVHDAISDLAAAAAAKRIALTASPHTSVALRCDPKRIAQVLGNLVANAVKFTPVGGAIELAVTDDPHEVRFSVHDNGPGIAPADLGSVFDRHWQAADVATQGQGRGLGLFIAKAIVEAHAGRIWVESVPGEGTTFSFTILRPAG